MSFYRSRTLHLFCFIDVSTDLLWRHRPTTAESARETRFAHFKEVEVCAGGKVTTGMVSFVGHTLALRSTRPSTYFLLYSNVLLVPTCLFIISVTVFLTQKLSGMSLWSIYWDRQVETVSNKKRPRQDNKNGCLLWNFLGREGWGRISGVLKLDPLKLDIVWFNHGNSKNLTITNP